MAVAATRAAFGNPYCLINNASIYPRGGILDLTLETWERTFKVNITAPWLLARAFGIGDRHGELDRVRPRRVDGQWPRSRRVIAAFDMRIRRAEQRGIARGHDVVGTIDAAQRRERRAAAHQGLEEP